VLNKKPMEIEKAIEILKDYNGWRRFQTGNDMPTESDPKMCKPRDLGIAIDTVVSHFESKSIINYCKACGTKLKEETKYCDLCQCKGNEAYEK
jgi:hypothetical protein